MTHTLILTEDQSRVRINTCNECSIVDECREGYYTRGHQVGYCNIMHIYEQEVYRKNGYVINHQTV